MSLLGSTLAAHGGNPAKTQMASLDHTIWFHRPFRADEWWLYDQWSPSAQGARGLAFGRIFTAGRHAGRHGRPGGPDPTSAVTGTTGPGQA